MTNLYIMNPISSTESPAVLKEFLGYMQTVKGKSQKTIQEYYFDLRTFFRFLKRSKKLVSDEMLFEAVPIDDVNISLLETVTLTDVFEFMNFVLSERDNHAAARARKSSSLRTFFQYLTNKTGQLKINPVLELETPRQKKSLPKYLTLEQSIDLLNSVDDGPLRERDYCILTLFLNCGMRLSELVLLNMTDVHFQDRTLKLTGKGNKERIVYLNDACIDALQAHIAIRKKEKASSPDDQKALFLSHLHRRMGRQAVQLMVYKYLGKIGLDGQGYSVHKLRHTAATLMYQHGNVDIRILKDILGHENLGTTEIYTHLSSEQMANAAESSPLARVKQRGTKKEEGQR